MKGNTSWAKWSSHGRQVDESRKRIIEKNFICIWRIFIWKIVILDHFHYFNIKIFDVFNKNQNKAFSVFVQ